MGHCCQKLNLTCRCPALASLRKTAPPNADHILYTWARPTYMNAPIDLYGHSDERGVRFQDDIKIVEVYSLPVAWKNKVFHSWRPLALSNILSSRRVFIFLADVGEHTVARLRF